LSLAQRRRKSGSPPLRAKPLRWLGLAAGLAVLAAAAIAGRVAFGDGPDIAAGDGGVVLLARGLPKPTKPAFTPGPPRLLSKAETTWRWAPVVRSTVARARPTADAPTIARLSTQTHEGTSNLVLIAGRRHNQGRLWLRVRLPIPPNETLGWVRRTALGGYQFVHTHLVVDLRQLSATLYRDGRKVFSAPVGVGKSYWPTPKGDFYIRNKLTRYASPFYGPIAFGTSARSDVLTDWPNGGFVGIHGTSQPELIPGRVSHGCIRLRNPDILRLARLMRVGTPLTIR
jgi:L,D-transpeptidase catalytic domain